MTNKIQKIKDWITEQQNGLMDAQGNFAYREDEGAYHILCVLDVYIDSLQEKPVSEELEDASNNALDKISKKYDIVNIKSCLEMFRLGAGWQKEQFEKDYTNLCNGIATVKGLAVAMTYNKGVADTKEQMMKNIWKDAQGNDLPEIDREVIVLLKGGKVAFAHRPYKGKYIGKSLTTGNIETFENQTYDKGEWNIPDVMYWLDCYLPKEIEL